MCGFVFNGGVTVHCTRWWLAALTQLDRVGMVGGGVLCQHAGLVAAPYRHIGPVRAAMPTETTNLDFYKEQKIMKTKVSLYWQYL